MINITDISPLNTCNNNYAPSGVAENVVHRCGKAEAMDVRELLYSGQKQKVGVVG